MTKGRRLPWGAAASNCRADIQSNDYFVSASDARAPGLGGLVKEMVEPERAQKAFRESDARYRLVFDSAPIAISVAHGTNVLYANPAYLEMFELSSLDELRDVNVLDLFAPEWRAQVLENIHRRAEGLPVPSSYEAEHVRKDGTRVSILLHVVRAVFADGPATVAFVSDISERKRAEGELRARDLRFRTFVEQAPVAISVSRDGVCLYSNRKFADLLGRETVNELIGAPIYLFFAPHMQTESKERTRLRRLGLASAPTEYDSVFERADGSQFPVHLAVGPVQLREGEAYIAFVTDITERLQVDEARRAGKAMGDVAERVARSGSWRRDLRTNEESWSDGMFALFDARPGDLDGDATRILEKCVHSSDLGPVMRARAVSPEAGEPLALEYRVVHGDGSEHVIYSDGTVEFDETGNPVATTGFCKDVTELSEALARLEGAAGEWSETFDAMGDAVAVLDGDGRIVRCNAATLEMTGLYIDDIVGRQYGEVFQELDGTGCLQHGSFETAHVQTNILEQNGRWLRMSCRPQVDAAGHVGGGGCSSSPTSASCAGPSRPPMSALTSSSSC